MEKRQNAVRSGTHRFQHFRFLKRTFEFLDQQFTSNNKLAELLKFDIAYNIQQENGMRLSKH
jgi:hypothetical protein